MVKAAPNFATTTRYQGERHAATAEDLEFAIGFALATMVVATTAQAAYPGKDGRLAFGARIGDNVDVYSMKENGNDLRRLTDAAAWTSVPPTPRTAMTSPSAVTGPGRSRSGR